AGSKKVMSENDKRIAATRAAGRSAVANAAAMNAASRSATVEANKLAQAQSHVANAGVSAAGGLSSQRYLLHDLSRQFREASLAAAAFPIAAIAAGAAWELSFAKVVRTSDLKDDIQGNIGQINALKSSLVSMAQAMPASFGDITEVATL